MDSASLRPEHLNLSWSEEDEQVLDVLDLPQLYQRPSHRSLLDTLSLLTLEPRSWDSTPPLTPSGATPRSLGGANTPVLPPRPKVRSEGVPQYLTRIISSPLAWISNDEEKEQVWDAASVRLSERSGRTGMGALTRYFRIPALEASAKRPFTDESDDDISDLERHDQLPVFDVQIHEPALTEDNLGLKTWASSYVLARNWHTLCNRLPRLPAHHNQKKATILELGAGTGLVGIAAAAVLRVDVLLTDLPDIVPNLHRNIDANRPSIVSGGGSATAAILDWTVPEKIIYPPQNEEEREDVEEGERRELVAGEEGEKYPLIVAADPIYSTNHPTWLVQTIDYHLDRIDDARAVVIMPIREAYLAEREDFKARMAGIGLKTDFDTTETGYDDWSEGKGEELAEVECWTSVWKWDPASLVEQQAEKAFL